VAWAIAVNGFASVFGSLLAPLVAMHLGYRVLTLAAAVLYMVAGVVSRGLEAAPRPPTYALPSYPLPPGLADRK